MNIKDKVVQAVKKFKSKLFNQSTGGVLAVLALVVLNMLFGAFVLSKLLTWFVLPVGVAAALGIKLTVSYLLRHFAKEKDDDVYLRKEDEFISKLGKSFTINVFVLFAGFIVSLFV